MTFPKRHDLNLVISRHDLRVLSDNVDEDASLRELVESIIHEWATNPARSGKNLSLPPTNSVLLKGETLRSYLRRVALATINAVYQEERVWTRVALRLGYERTAFSKFVSRLKSGGHTGVHSNREGDDVRRQRRGDLHGEGSSNHHSLIPLRLLIEEHFKQALAACEGDKEQACTLLGISAYQLASVRSALRAHPQRNQQLFYISLD